ncbi:FAD-dependent oxidoreductase [Nocardioides sp. HDW12B]|uniref:FAD-dependent oxidoreductase n=1 Tax=Nocardioides sp. HDW12B TaxID=2714939 RepID=UPI001980DB06|nr:FAD-dependent oxidoreductase [Nocardioides sp. HDW12B]
MENDRGGSAEIRADVCVVGAGIAGLNALWVAAQYLGPDQTAVLVDRNDRPGGMWVNTYDYVRLHQPHPFFTTGNVAWTIDKPPEYLADKGEVLDHLRHCLDEIKKKTTVVELFGHELEQHDEVDGTVRVVCRGADGQRVTVVADRLVKAVGLSVETNPALALSSTAVHSVSPDFCDMRDGGIAQDSAPVWIVGGGKTAMDTALALVTAQPGRSVNLLAGAGTFFSRRDYFFATGGARWWRRTLAVRHFAMMADAFDGTNAQEVLDATHRRFGHAVTERADRYIFGLLGDDEARQIRAGLDQVRLDYLVDAVDTSEGVELRLRSGEVVPVEPGTWVVNCTGYLNGREDNVHEPYVSESGRTVVIGRTPMFGFTSFAGYFLTHLAFLDKITEVPLYQLDGDDLLLKSKAAFSAAAATLVQYNLGLVLDAVPRSVFATFGLDFNLWYAPPRTLVDTLRFVVAHKRKRPAYQAALDTMATTYDVRCGPVEVFRTSVATGS